MIDINKLNLSLLALLPLALESPTTYTKLLGESLSALMNGFSGDINRPWLDKHVIVVFDPEKMDTYRVNGLIKLKNHTMSKIVNIDKTPLLMHALKIDDEYQKDADLIRFNRFSELRTSVKIRILSFWKQNEDSDLYKVLFSRNYSGNSIAKELLPEESCASQAYVILSGGYTL